MASPRAIHQAARARIEARFFSDWCAQPPFAAFAPSFRSVIECLDEWPAPGRYDELAALVAQPKDDAPSGASSAVLPRFIAQDREALRRAGGYEQHVARRRAVPTRERSWHDFFNMAVWAHFPRTRWALNALHVDDTLGPVDPRNGRAPQQNVAAQLDESGLVVVSSSRELLEELKQLCFKRVFWERRAELLATTRFWVIGHGTLESLLTPHLGLACKAVLLELPLPPASYDEDELRWQTDVRVAAVVSSWRAAAPALAPVPVLGIPDYAANAAGEFYDDARYFRFHARSRT